MFIGSPDKPFGLGASWMEASWSKPKVGSLGESCVGGVVCRGRWGAEKGLGVIHNLPPRSGIQGHWLPCWHISQTLREGNLMPTSL